MATMGNRAFGFLLSEANGTLSRGEGEIAAGEGKLAAGTVLGRVTATAALVASPAAEVAGKEGAEVAVAILGRAVDATDAAVSAVLVERSAEVIEADLVFAPSVDDDEKRAEKLGQLADRGLIAR